MYSPYLFIFTYFGFFAPTYLDEAYLDVTENKKGVHSATWIAKEIKQSILKETGLIASAGVSINKFLAKVASDIDKPDGLFLISPEMAESFVEQLPVEKFYGVGKITAAKMNYLGIQVGADLKKWSPDELMKQFGKSGILYYKMARAQDDRAVNPNRIRKSIGAETTFEQDLNDIELINIEIAKLAQVLKERLDKNSSYGRTLTLKIKYADFHQVTRSITENYLIQDINVILSLAKKLLLTTNVGNKEVRLLGISISNLAGEEPDVNYVQLSLEL